MEFNIVDGDDDYLEKLPEFVEEYNSNTSNIEELIVKLGITRCEYTKLRRAGLEEGLIELRRRPYRKKETYKKNPKNYSFTVNHGKVYFTVTKNGTYYTSCKTEAQAKEIVERLKECGWDKSKALMIKKEVCQME